MNAKKNMEVLKFIGEQKLCGKSIWNTGMVKLAQRAEAILNKISNNSNKAYTGLINVLQGFQKSIAWNPSKLGMEGLC